MSHTSPARTRLAPSPTGFMHIGTLRTALYCYLWAHHTGGQYLVRVEDTDRTRLVEGSLEDILDIHDELGMTPDESPRNPGNVGPYIQSERLAEYAPRLHQLCEEGSAYYCFCSSERLENLKKEQEELKLPPRYDGHCRDIPLEEARERIANGESYTIRLKVPKAEKIVFNDLIRGRIEFNTSEIDDQVLLKSDGKFPTYHGAIVIDDYLMGITHVMRGEEWISSIPKQVLTARALRLPLPEYAHLPNVLGADGKKLSKRMGDVSVRDYLAKGYTKEGLLNFLALLGWHPKTEQEVMTMDEMIRRFEISDIHKAGAVLDPMKLDWMNSEHIKRFSLEELRERIQTYLAKYQKEFYENTYSKASIEFNMRVIQELQGRMKRFEEYEGLTNFLYGEPNIRTDLLVNPKMKIESLDFAKNSLELGLKMIEGQEDFSSIDVIKERFLPMIAESGLKNGQVLWPMRVALSGEEFSPGAFELVYILGKAESLKRIQNVFQLIKP